MRVLGADNVVVTLGQEESSGDLVYPLTAAVQDVRTVRALVYRDIEVVRGDDGPDLRLTVVDAEGTIVDLTGGRVWMHVRVSTGALLPVLTKDSAVGPTEVEIDDPTNGSFIIRLVASDTLGWKPGTYVYDVEIQIGTPVQVSTVVAGDFVVLADVTRPAVP